MKSRTALLTLLTLFAFAGNSLLCRAALRDGAIDPLAFTVVRLTSGALVLLPLVRRPGAPWNPRAALALGGYAVAFSMAYLTLDAGVGALLLFGSVQVTMFAVAWRRGERWTRVQVLGLLLALIGLTTLLLPGSHAPDPTGAGLMILAGVGWGAYSLAGQGAAGSASGAPTVATARNFLLVVPLMLPIVPFASWELQAEGLALAVLSGAVTSGLGYVLWYAALGGLDATRAAVVQLAVPVIAAALGILLLQEPLTARLVGGGAITLGGIAAVLQARTRATTRHDRD